MNAPSVRLGLLGRLLPLSWRQRLLQSLGAAPVQVLLQVLNNSPDLVLVTRTRDERVLAVNPRLQELSGYRPDEVIGSMVCELPIWVQEEQRQAMRQDLTRLGYVSERTVHLRRKDGAVRDCLLSATLVSWNDARPTHCVWVARDVTTQYAVDAQFKAAFQMTPDFMSITSLRDGRLLEVNAAFERITGLSRAEAIGRTSIELDIWEFPQERDALLQRLAEEGRVNDHLVHLRNRSGELREALLNAAAFENLGEPCMIALLRDVTDMRRATQALQESEARFARVFDQSPLPMCYASDSDGFNSAQWNQAWFKAFGFDPALAQGKSGRALNIWVHAEERSQLLTQALRGDNVSDAEIQLRRADGEVRWFSLSTRTFSESQRTLIVFSYFDITERKLVQQEVLRLNGELEQRVAQRTEQLQCSNRELSQTLDTLRRTKDHLVQSEKLAALGALVAGVAHELNTPIGNSLTVASSLEHRNQTFAQQFATGLKRSELQGYVEDMRLAADILVRNLRRAGELVTSFKQVAVDQTSSQRRRFSLQALVQEILVTLIPAIRNSGCQVDSDVSEDLWLDSYPGPLGQVLTNLINNAMEHGYADGAQGHIRVSTLALAPDRVQIEVCDDGRGIGADAIAHVFEPFFTTRLGQGGSGLGLHIVHNIVTGILGGTISVHSDNGQGARFVLVLPTCAPMPPDSSPSFAI